MSKIFSFLGYDNYPSCLGVICFFGLKKIFGLYKRINLVRSGNPDSREKEIENLIELAEKYTLALNNCLEDLDYLLNRPNLRNQKNTKHEKLFNDIVASTVQTIIELLPILYKLRQEIRISREKKLREKKLINTEQLTLVYDRLNKSFLSAFLIVDIRKAVCCRLFTGVNPLELSEEQKIIYELLTEDEKKALDLRNKVQKKKDSEI